MAVFNTVGGSDPQIGDFKDSIGTVSSRWLTCNGAGVNSSKYPELVSLLQTAFPADVKLDLPYAPYTEVSSKAYPYCQGSAYYNGTWAIACCGYDSNTSRTVYKPVVYVANDINGAWTPVTLSDGNYYLSGILYSQRFESWIAYGYKYVSDTECYPYIFDAADPYGTWTAKQIASTCCKINTGAVASGSYGSVYFIAKGCGSNNSSYAYAYSSGSYITSAFSENNFSTSFSGTPRGLCYGNGYWAFCNKSQAIYYATSVSETWTSKTIISGSVYLRDFAYGNGTWTAVGYQSSGGSGRLWTTTNLTGTWTDRGIFDVNGENTSVAYCDGVWITLSMHIASVYYLYCSTNNWQTYKSIRLTNSYTQAPTICCFNGQWLIGHMYCASVFRRPEADAALPIKTPSIGKTYIKAK